MPDPAGAVVGVACSIFREEIETLRARGEVRIPFRYLDSMLHMVPESLHRGLDLILDEEARDGRKVLLLFGECHPHMVEHQSRPGVCRARGLNCCEIFLGPEQYRAMRKEGVFFLLAEWTRRWKTVFQQELGLDDDNARSLMGRMHSRLVYLDTGLAAVPREELKAIAEYTGLPCEVMEVTLGPLRDAVDRGLEALCDHDDQS